MTDTWHHKDPAGLTPRDNHWAHKDLTPIRDRETATVPSVRINVNRIQFVGPGGKGMARVEGVHVGVGPVLDGVNLTSAVWQSNGPGGLLGVRNEQNLDVDLAGRAACEHGERPLIPPQPSTIVYTLYNPNNSTTLCHPRQPSTTLDKPQHSTALWNHLQPLYNPGNHHPRYNTRQFSNLHHPRQSPTTLYHSLPQHHTALYHPRKPSIRRHNPLQPPQPSTTPSSTTTASTPAHPLGSQFWFDNPLAWDGLVIKRTMFWLAATPPRLCHRVRHQCLLSFYHHHHPSPRSSFSIALQLDTGGPTSWVGTPTTPPPLTVHRRPPVGEGGAGRGGSGRGDGGGGGLGGAFRGGKVREDRLRGVQVGQVPSL